MQYMKFGQSPKSVSQSGSRERLFLVLDASPSMEEKDWPPSRIEAAKDAARALIKCKLAREPDDEVGIITYADFAKTLSKPRHVAVDYKVLIQSLAKMTTGGGTNIAAGLTSVEQMLLISNMGNRISQFITGRSVPQSPKYYRIILLTDGHHNCGPASSVSEVADRLKRRGVTIDCIGIGGNPCDVDEGLLKSIASENQTDGSPRYAFIGERAMLIERFEHLAGRITR